MRGNVLAPLSPNARLRFDVIDRVLGPLTEAGSFLEIGCGQGALATILAQRYDYVGYEPDEVTYRIARDRIDALGRGRVINSTLPATPDRTFDIVAAFEVLEHLEDDAGALADWAKWVRPGGHLVISVPANPKRFGPSDEYAGHFRRYTRDGLQSLLTGAGMSDVKVLICGFPLGYFLESVRNVVLARRLRTAPSSLAARTSRSGRNLQLNAGFAPLIWALTLPFRLLQRPFVNGGLGTGFVVRGERSS